MEFENIIFEKADGIGILTLNRPNALNSLNMAVVDEIHEVIEQCRVDYDVRVLVIKGTGRAFCAGDDIKGAGVETKRRITPDDRVARELASWPGLVPTFRSLRKPIIACIHGFAVGAGFDLSLACDIRFAAEDAKMGSIYIARAVSGGTTLLPYYVGYGKACELLFTGDLIDGKEAERLGIVNKAVPADQLESTVMEFAARLAKAPTKVIGYAKLALNRGWDADLNRALEYQAISSMDAMQSGDYKEGVESFRDKREPKFTGR